MKSLKILNSKFANLISKNILYYRKNYNTIYLNQIKRSFVVKYQKKFFFTKKEQKEVDENNNDNENKEDRKINDNDNKNAHSKNIEDNNKGNSISKKDYDELNTLYKDTEEHLSKARIKFDELRKAYLTLQSDLERLRKRSEIDVANAKDFAITKFAKDIIEIYDNFERALEYLKPLNKLEEESNEKSNNENEELLISNKIKIYQDFAEGVLMTKTSLNKILNFHGITQFNPMNEKFDPNLHEAISQISSNEHNPGTVVSVMQSGFTISKRLLRPAKVVVTKK